MKLSTTIAMLQVLIPVCVFAQGADFNSYLNERLSLSLRIHNLKTPEARFSLAIERVSDVDGLKVAATETDMERILMQQATKEIAGSQLPQADAAKLHLAARLDVARAIRLYRHLDSAICNPKKFKVELRQLKRLQAFVDAPFAANSLCEHVRATLADRSSPQP